MVRRMPSTEVHLSDDEADLLDAHAFAAGLQRHEFAAALVIEAMDELGEPSAIPGVGRRVRLAVRRGRAGTVPKALRCVAEYEAPTEG